MHWIWEKMKIFLIQWSSFVSWRCWMLMHLQMWFLKIYFVQMKFVFNGVNESIFTLKQSSNTNECRFSVKLTNLGFCLLSGTTFVLSFLRRCITFLQRFLFRDFDRTILQKLDKCIVLAASMISYWVEYTNTLEQTDVLNDQLLSRYLIHRFKPSPLMNRTISFSFFSS